MSWLKKLGLWLSGDAGYDAGHQEGQKATLHNLIELIKKLKKVRWIFTVAYTISLLICVYSLKSLGVHSEDNLSQICKFSLSAVPLLFPWLILRPLIQKELAQYEQLDIKVSDLLGPLSTITNVIEANAVLFLWKIVMDAQSLEDALQTIQNLLF